MHRWNFVHTECERGKEFGRKGEKEGERFSEMEEEVAERGKNGKWEN